MAIRRRSDLTAGAPTPAPLRRQVNLFVLPPLIDALAWIEQRACQTAAATERRPLTAVVLTAAACAALGAALLPRRRRRRWT